MICRPAFVTDTDEHGELKGHLEYFGHGKCIVKVLLSLMPHILAKLTSISRQGFKKAPYIKMCDPIKSTPKRERTPYHIKDGKHYIRKVYEGPPGASKDFFGIIYVEMEKGRYYDEIMENLNETWYVPFEPPFNAFSLFMNINIASTTALSP